MEKREYGIVVRISDKRKKKHSEGLEEVRRIKDMKKIRKRRG